MMNQIARFSPLRRRSADRQHGLTIVEFTIAIALGLMIIAALLTIFANSSRSRTELQKSSQQKENGRYAAQLLADNLALAGYLAEFDPTVLTSPATLPDPCATGDTDLLDAMPLHVQGVDNAVSTPNCLTDVKANTDILVIRRASTCASGAADCDPFNAAQAHFQASSCRPTDGSFAELAAPTNNNAAYATNHFTLGTLDQGAFTKRKVDCINGNFADISRYLVQIYFVANNNQPGDGIPTLKHWELGTGIVPLVDGIENLQIEYGIDNDNNGTPDTWTPAPATIQNWRDAMAVRINVLARNTTATTGYVDSRSYTLGRDESGTPVTVGPFGDEYKRHVYTTTSRLTNPSWRRQ